MKIIASTGDNRLGDGGYIVEVSRLEMRRLTGDTHFPTDQYGNYRSSNDRPGTEVNVVGIYDRMTAIEAIPEKMRKVQAELRAAADLLYPAIERLIPVKESK